MITLAGARAASAGVGKRSINACHFGITRSTWVCWDMTSLTSTSHGSRVLRHGRSLASSLHHPTTAATPSEANGANSLSFLARVTTSVFPHSLLCSNLAEIVRQGDMADSKGLQADQTDTPRPVRAPAHASGKVTTNVEGHVGYRPAHVAEDDSIKPVLLSTPDLGDAERHALLAAFDENSGAPTQSAVTEFESKLAGVAGTGDAVALLSGASVLHLALILLGVGRRDIVLVPALSQVETANAVRHVGAIPIFIDCDPSTGNIDPHLLDLGLRGLANSYRTPAAVITADLYGSCADYSRIEAICANYGVPLLEYGATSLGSTHGGRAAGSFGTLAAFNFAGSGLISSEAGGALVGPRPMIERARRLAGCRADQTRAFEQHELGYGYRLPNLLAALGCAHLDRLVELMGRTRQINRRYAEVLSMLPGVSLIDIDRDGVGNGAQSVVTIDQNRLPTPSQICAHMAKDGIEARPVELPLHRQTRFVDATVIGGGASEAHAASSLCLPSGSGMTRLDHERVIASFLDAITNPPDPKSAAVIDLAPAVDVRSEQLRLHLDNPVATHRAA